MAKLTSIRAIPAAGFRLLLVDSPKPQLGKEMMNAGYFGIYHEEGEEFTLPAGHLTCDWVSFGRWTRHYGEERGHFEGDKFFFDCSTWSYRNQFQGKALSTLVVRGGKACIVEAVELPEGEYAVSGVPVIRGGKACTWGQATAQGWTKASCRPTWHAMAGLKEDADTVYLFGLKSYTSNLVKSGEAAKKLLAMGFRDVIKLDGGMSFYMNADGKTTSTGGDRRINTIIPFPGGEEEMTEYQLRSAVVASMKRWLGCSEKNGKHKQIIDTYNAHKPLARGYQVKYTDEWCAATVSAAFIVNGLTDIAPTECSCSKMIRLYKTMGRWQEKDSYIPTPGDIILYDWDDSGKGDNTGGPDHVGIVALVSGKTIQVIEGNKGEAVAYRTMRVDARYIRGYCLPDYAGKANKKTGGSTVDVTLKVLKNGSKGTAVKALQILLNGLGYACGAADGVFGAKTLAAVKQFQKAKELDADGFVGEQTWSALLGA